MDRSLRIAPQYIGTNTKYRALSVSIGEANQARSSADHNVCNEKADSRPHIAREVGWGKQSSVQRGYSSQHQSAVAFSHLAEPMDAGSSYMPVDLLNWFSARPVKQACGPRHLGMLPSSAILVAFPGPWQKATTLIKPSTIIHSRGIPAWWL